MLRNLIRLVAAVLLSAPPVTAGVISVPGDFPTIQSAIDHAAPGDDIEIDAGRWEEDLVIRNTSLRLFGGGRGQTMVHSYHGLDSTPVVRIENADVTFVDLDLSGGRFVGGAIVDGSRSGVVATRSSLTLERVRLDRFIFSFVRVELGELNALDVTLGDNQNIALGSDLGFDLIYSDATISGLTVYRGRIDHVVMVNGTAEPPEDPGYRSWIFVGDSFIALNDLSWGDGISLQHHADADIRHNTFYRDPAAVMPSTSKALGLVGPHVTAQFVENRVENAAVGILFSGSTPDNGLLMEYNEFLEYRNIGVAIYGLNHDGVDLGGGAFGSHGRNTFCRNSTPGRGYDVKYTWFSQADVRALDTTWSTREPAVAIWDLHDTSLVGEVVFQAPGHHWNTCAP